MDDLRVGDAVSPGCLVEQIKEPLDRRRKRLVGGEDGVEKVIDELLYCALGGQQSGQEDLRDGLVCALRRVLVVLVVVFIQLTHQMIHLDTQNRVPNLNFQFIKILLACKICKFFSIEQFNFLNNFFYTEWSKFICR